MSTKLLSKNQREFIASSQKEKMNRNFAFASAWKGEMINRFQGESREQLESRVLNCLSSLDTKGGEALPLSFIHEFISEYTGKGYLCAAYGPFRQQIYLGIIKDDKYILGSPHI